MIRITRDGVVGALWDGVPKNLDRYRAGSFDFLTNDQSQYHELPVKPVASALTEVKLPKADQLFEVENCLAMYRYLRDLRLYDARDERLWVYLSHVELLSYARARWPIPSDRDKAIAHVRTHFFARTNRQIERDNVASRLWWMAHLCTRVDGVSQRDALGAFLLRSDVRANIIERPTVAQSANVFSVILRALIRSAKGKQALFERSTFRRIMVELNSIGGFKLLDVLPESDLAGIFEEVVKTRIGISAV